MGWQIRVTIYGTFRQENKYNYDYDEINLPNSSSWSVNPKLSMYGHTPINSRLANKAL